MTKIFRKIRQKLLTENKLSKYIFYAIGEIILVVIGILIALKINNANEYNKNRIFEKEILTQINDNLSKDKRTLELIKLNFQDAKKSSQSILSSKWEQQDLDSLKYWLGNIIQFERFQPITNAYEVLKSKGLDQVSNNDLRLLLGKYYDDESRHIAKSIGDLENTFNSDWMPILKEVVEDFKFQEYVIVNNKTIFKKGFKGYNLLKINKDNYRNCIHRLSNTIITIKEVQKEIEKELD